MGGKIEDVKKSGSGKCYATTNAWSVVHIIFQKVSAVAVIKVTAHLFCQEVSKRGRSAHITNNSGGSDCANETASGLTGRASVRISYMEY